MQNDHVLKKLNYDLLTQSPWGRGGDRGSGVCGKICHHVAAFCGSIYFNMQHDHVLKKLNFDPLTPIPRVLGEGEGSLGKIFATMLLHFVIPS